MKRMRAGRMKVVAAAGAMLVSTPAWAQFGDAGWRVLRAAAKRADEQGKMLVVTFSSPFCSECPEMDRTTWSDERVRAWLNEHAKTIRIDTATMRGLDERLNVRSTIPVVLIMKGQKEFDRFAGTPDADDVLEWFEAALEGKTRLDLAREASLDGSVAGLSKRYEVVDQLIEVGRYPEAADELVWLWNKIGRGQILSRITLGAAVSRTERWVLTRQMEAVVKKYPEAVELFVPIRDELSARLRDQPTDGDARHEWIFLNDVLGDAEITAEWIRAASEDPLRQDELRAAGTWVSGFLKEQREWALLGSLSVDPLARVRNQFAMFASARTRLANAAEGAGRERRMVGQRRGEILERVPQLYASLLAAGRDQDASKVAAYTLEHYDEPARMKFAIAHAAWIAESVRPIHIQWAIEAGEAGETTEGLLVRLRRALPDDPPAD